MVRYMAMAGALLLAGCGGPDCGDREAWSGTAEVGPSFPDVQVTVFFYRDHDLGIQYSGSGHGCVMDEAGTWDPDGLSDSVDFRYTDPSNDHVQSHWTGIVDSTGRHFSGKVDGSATETMTLTKRGSGPTSILPY